MRKSKKKTGRRTVKRAIRNYAISCLSILLILNLTVKLHAQDQDDLRFERITVEHGLPHSVVNVIFQDTRGFMWFVTQDGLARYDGYEFRVFRHDPGNSRSLSGNLLMTGLEDRSGIIWLGDDLTGLNRFDPETETFTRYRHDPEDPHSLSHNSVWSLHEDHEGVLWVGTRDGLNRFDRETGTFTRHKPDPNDPHSLSCKDVVRICEDRSKTLWFGTRQGLNRFDRKTGTFTQYHHDPDDPRSLGQENVWAICEDRLGVLWVGTRGGGLNKFDPETETFTRYKHDPDNPHGLNGNNVWAIHEDREGILWVGTENGGLNRFDRKTETFAHYPYDAGKPESLSFNYFWSIFEDDAGALWIGTRGGGVSKLDRGMRKFVRYHHDPTDSESLSSDNVNAIMEDRSGMVWIGTQGGGLDRFDPKSGKFAHYKHDPENPDSLSDNDVWAIREDRGGTLWIGMQGGGLNKFDRQTETFTRYKSVPNDPKTLSYHTVTAIYEDRTGTLWAGTLGMGLNRFDRQTETFTRFRHDPADPRTLGDDTINAIYEDHKARVWIGTFRGGLHLLDIKTGTFVCYRHDPADSRSLGNNNVRAVCEGDPGILWVGTQGGLDRLDVASGKFTHYLTKHGLPNDTIYGALKDDQGNIWLSTGKGLSRFSPYSGKFRNYDTADGLQSNEFNAYSYFKSSCGVLYFGGPGGFNTVFPARMKENPHIPNVVLTDFQLFNRPPGIGGDSPLQRHISATSEITLSHMQNVFSFEFAALNYRLSEKNLYQYMMEGFDKEWSPPSRRHSVTYTNLDHGRYTFRVRGSNNDGVWNKEGTSVRMRITPPPWKSWWAYALYVMSVLSAVLTFLCHQRNKLEQQRMLAEQKTEAKLLMQEMEIAKHIQTALSPEKPVLPGYEIAATMEPADEVGGDYYDFISVAGHDWIVIGDVSGHGVPAGLVMMMVQTAIHTVLTGNPETPPSRLLSLINRTICENIEKMDESRHMTIVVLAGGRDGNFTFAGLHEDILIRRAATGRVEAVETDGMWIGIEPDISEMLSEDTLKLEPGDCMILFTDGITEAWDRDGNLFGDERLMRIIEESGESPASEVHKNVITALESWERPDDVTLVVVKRLRTRNL